MANNSDVNKSDWVEERLEALNTAAESQPDIVRARARLRARQSASTTQNRGLWLALAATGCLLLLALPWPRALAQQLWDRLLLGRIAVVEVDREGLSEDIKSVFIMTPGDWVQQSVADAAEAEQIAGFHPLLPPAGVLNGDPKMSVVTRVTLSTRRLNTADMERALANAGVSDMTVPKEWEGLTLTAEAGPAIIAEYEGVEIVQSPPFRMNTPPGFQFGRFMEMAFRVFGRSAHEARMLGAKFEANPALVLHFPERAPVRDVTLRSGHGIIVGDVGGTDPICFFWNTPDRIYIVTASNVSEQRLTVMADSIR
jgi:hypothetical protein